jgi:hypothetical protein
MAEAMDRRARRDALEAEIALLETALSRAEERLARLREEESMADVRAADARVARWMLFATALIFVAIVGLVLAFAALGP